MTRSTAWPGYLTPSLRYPSRYGRSGLKRRIFEERMLIIEGDRIHGYALSYQF